MSFDVEHKQSFKLINVFFEPFFPISFVLIYNKNNRPMQICYFFTEILHFFELKSHFFALICDLKNVMFIFPLTTSLGLVRCVSVFTIDSNAE